jgi:hypothetical protein
LNNKHTSWSWSPERTAFRIRQVVVLWRVEHCHFGLYLGSLRNLNGVTTVDNLLVMFCHLCVKNVGVLNFC